MSNKSYLFPKINLLAFHFTPDNLQFANKLLLNNNLYHKNGEYFLNW